MKTTWSLSLSAGSSVPTGARVARAPDRSSRMRSLSQTPPATPSVRSMALKAFGLVAMRMDISCSGADDASFRTSMLLAAMMFETI
eukprot:5594042-Pleurochrysis_carterae.AAC.1